MKKLILLLSIIALFFQSSFAQTGGLNFQGVARNATGAVIANQKINLKFSILKTTETGTVEYTETKEATTNAQGIFAVVVGEVNATSFAAVDWKVTPKFLKVEMDAAGGTSFITMGTTRLQNVPFAYYANGVNANNIDGTVPVSKGGTGAINAAGARSNIGAESIANKSTDLIADATSTTKYPSVKVIKDYVDTKVTSGSVSGTVAIEKGGTGASTASAALTNLGAESTANKSIDITADAASLTKYPSVKSIKDYVDTRVITGVSSSTDLNITSVNGLKLGRGAGTNTSSVAVGDFALLNNSNGDNNVAVGYQALRFNVTGDYNSAVGVFALGDNFNGSQNTAVGLEALRYNEGNNNSAAGVYALYRNTTGSENVALGKESGILNTVGSNNTFLGSLSNAGSNNLTNATALGNGAIVSASNTIQLGNNAITDVKTSGAITASGYKTPTGTSTQFLMADGSVSVGNTSNTFTNKVNVGSATETSNSAILEVNSTSKGFLPPRMTFAQRNLISNPTPGLMIYCSDCGTYGEWQGYNGNRWTNISGAPASSSSINIFSREIISRRTGRIWMDRNLGASRVATISSDPDSYGDYYQWGRPADGHQIRTSTTTTTLSSSDQPNNDKFIVITNITYQLGNIPIPFGDWRSPQNDNLWQGVNGINNPCPNGFRLPTIGEFEAEFLEDSNDAFTHLKIPLAGERSSKDLTVSKLGESGYYWSSTISAAFITPEKDARAFLIRTGTRPFSTPLNRAQGVSIRCIKN